MMKRGKEKEVCPSVWSVCESSEDLVCVKQYHAEFQEYKLIEKCGWILTNNKV